MLKQLEDHFRGSLPSFKSYSTDLHKERINFSFKCVENRVKMSRCEQRLDHSWCVFGKSRPLSSFKNVNDQESERRTDFRKAVLDTKNPGGKYGRRAGRNMTSFLCRNPKISVYMLAERMVTHPGSKIKDLSSL